MSKWLENWAELLRCPIDRSRLQIATVAHWVPTTPKFVQQQASAAQKNPAGYAAGLVSGHQDMTYQPDPLSWNPGALFGRPANIC